MSARPAQNLTRRVTFTSALMIVLCTALLVWNLATAQNGRMTNGVGVGADYLAFYNAGDILNRFGAGHLYDLTLQSELYHQRLPGEPPEASLPFANGPQVTLIFSSLARVPYTASYVAWTVMSVTLYLVGIVAFCSAAGLSRTQTQLAILVACAFEPFLVETIHGGQISSLAFALFGIGSMLLVRHKPTLAGFVFGSCCYKPTLLVVLIPALVVTRRWRELAGCALAMSFWATVCLFVFGPQPCLDHVRLLTHYAADTGAAQGVFRAWKFVDLTSFLTLAGVPKFFALMITGVGGLCLLKTLRARCVASDPDHNHFFLASVLAFTPVLNVYAGIYDAVLVAGSIFLVCGVLLRRHLTLPPGVVRVLGCVAITPWVTAYVAQSVGLQIFTLALLAWGAVVLRLMLAGVADAETFPTRSAPASLREEPEIASYYHVHLNFRAPHFVARVVTLRPGGIDQVGLRKSLNHERNRYDRQQHRAVAGDAAAGAHCESRRNGRRP